MVQGVLMISKFSRKDFLEALFSQYYKEHRGFILVKSFKRGESKHSTRFFPNLDILAKEHYGEERDVYFGVCPRERMKAEREYIKYVVALWADLDIGEEGHENKKRFFPGPQEAAKAIRSFPKPPSIIVESGRGAHLYWLLREVTEVADPEYIENILKNISDYLHCDTDVTLDTVARLPETVNTKIPGKPVNCDVKFINTNFRYSLQDFENLGTPKIVALPSQKSPPETSPVLLSTLGAERGGEIPTHEAEQIPIPRANDFEVTEVDETVLDRWVDEISMGTSVVETATGVEPVHLGSQIEQIPEEYEPDVVSTVSEVRVPQERPRVPGVSPKEGNIVLSQLCQTGTEVEIVFMGSGEYITGVLTWVQDGLIGVAQEGYSYVIPLSSVSFIRYRTD